MKSLVYIETSIPSFYFEVRTDPDIVARREWTRQWWDEMRQEYLLVTSAAVLDELSGGDYPTREQTISLIAELPHVTIELAVLDVVNAYIQHKVMPNDPVGDTSPGSGVVSQM